MINFAYPSNAVNGLLAALRSQPLRGATFGDSLSAQGFGSQYPLSDAGQMSKATTAPILQNNMFLHACRLAGVRFVRCAGIGGQQSNQIMLRTASDILASSGGGINTNTLSYGIPLQYLPAPNLVQCLLGTNDYGSGYTTDYRVTLNNIWAVWNELIGAGVVPIACPLPPRSDNGGSWPAYTGAGTFAGLLTFLGNVNAGIRQMAASLGLPLFDYDALFNNGSGNYLGSVGTYSTDGVHPNMNGYWVAGQAMAPVLAGIRGQLAPLSSSNTDPLIVPGQTVVTQLNGGVLVNGSTGGQPTGYGTSHSAGANAWTPTFTTEPSDGYIVHGNWAKMVIAAISGNVTSLADYMSFCEITYNANSWVPTPGHRMMFNARVATAGLVAGNCAWSVMVIFNSSFNGQTMAIPIGQGCFAAPAQLCQCDVPLATYPGGAVISTEFIVPPYTTSMQLSVRLNPIATGTAMSGSIQMAQPTLIDLDAQGVL